MDYSSKAESLAEKMNKITAKLTENLEIAEDLDISGNDIVEYVEEKTDVIEAEVVLSTTEILNLQVLTEDFKFVRETLQSCIKSTHKVLNSITLDLLDADDEKKSGLILSLAELNRSITDSSKLYINVYREISNVLLNIDKINKTEKCKDPKVVNNTVNINTSTPINTADLISKLRGENK